MRLRLCVLVQLLFVLYNSLSAQFLERSEELGIDHIHLSVRSLGGGAAFFDYNNDGFLDLYITGGGKNDKLYLNLGDDSFYDVSEQTGVNSYTEGYQTSSSVISGDINNDGCNDLLVTTYDDRRNILLLNKCDGTFQNISFIAGLTEEALSMGASFLDYNQDGLLDIYVVNYVKNSNFILNEEGEIIGFDHDCWENYFYINQGNNEFIEASQSLSADNDGCGLAVVTTDFDRDGYSDLYMANDFGEWVVPNSALWNDQLSNSFNDISSGSGLDIGVYGMGIAAGDYDGDLDMDYYVTNLGKNQLLENNGSGQYQNVAFEKGVENGSDNEGNFTTGWGTFFFDYDNDSDLDLFVSNGFTGAVEFLSPADDDPNKLFENINGSFTDVSVQQGIGLTYRNRGAAFGDYDNDGDIDIFVVTLNGQDSLYSPFYENTNTNSNSWVDLKLEGSLSNRDAIGALITLYYNGNQQIYEISSGGSYASQSSHIAHFGLADASSIDSAEINWGADRFQVWRDLPVNQKIYLKEGEGNYQIMGCTDPANTFYNELATFSSGCKTDYIIGCTDPDALNYNSRANLSGGECVYEQDITSLKNEDNYDLLVYPNPLENTINMSYSAYKNGYSVKIISLMGVEVYSKRDIFTEELRLDLSSYPGGIYFLLVKDHYNHNQLIVKKLLKR